jgi:hypothetical protein
MEQDAVIGGDTLERLRELARKQRIAEAREIGPLRIGPRLRDHRAITEASLGEIAHHNWGPDFNERALAGLMSFVMKWVIANESLGRTLTVDDFGEYWGESTRTVYRSLKRFREVFPSEHDPDRIGRLVEGRPNARGWRTLADIRVPLA